MNPHPDLVFYQMYERWPEQRAALDRWQALTGKPAVNTRPSLGHPEASLGASWPSDRCADRARGIAGRNVASHGEWTRLRFKQHCGYFTPLGEPHTAYLRRLREISDQLYTFART